LTYVIKLTHINRYENKKSSNETYENITKCKGSG